MGGEADVVIIGAGLAGLAAATRLGGRAVVLERAARAGGLARTSCFDGYWFDHVLHVLYFADDATESHIRGLLGDDLRPCHPRAWVETQFGTVRYPFQMHLGGLDPEARARCLSEFERALTQPDGTPPRDFEELLRRSFGEGMCEVFLFPWNRKAWKRPLSSLGSSEFTWSITPPDPEAVREGAHRPEREFLAYNSRGWYPQPPRDSPVRGMEILARALAARTPDLRLRHTVVAVDLEARIVVTEHDGRADEFHFRNACIATIPLPAIVAACRQAPRQLREACSRLPRNRVLSGTFSVRGPRPADSGHWRYYADESLVFTRLSFPHAFDPLSAPQDGWGILVEVTERSEDPPADPAVVLAGMRADLERAGALPPGCEIIDAHLIVIDPAYVVFTAESRQVAEEARGFLRSHGVEPLGRFGRWEYSSMGQVLRDGFACGERHLRGGSRSAPLASHPDPMAPAGPGAS